MKPEQKLNFRENFFQNFDQNFDQKFDQKMTSFWPPFFDDFQKCKNPDFWKFLKILEKSKIFLRMYKDFEVPKKKAPKKNAIFCIFFFCDLRKKSWFSKKKKCRFFSEGLYGPLGGGGGAHFFPKFLTSKNHAKISQKIFMKNCKFSLCMSISM